MTDIRLTVEGSGDDVAELHDLYKTFTTDSGLRPVKKELDGIASPGDLGADEFIRLVADNAEILGAIANCVGLWLTTRRGELRVRVVGDAGAAEIEAVGPEAVNSETVLRALEVASRGTSGEAARP